MRNKIFTCARNSAVVKKTNPSFPVQTMPYFCVFVFTCVKCAGVCVCLRAHRCLCVIERGNMLTVLEADVEDSVFTKMCNNGTLPHCQMPLNYNQIVDLKKRNIIRNTEWDLKTDEIHSYPVLFDYLIRYCDDSQAVVKCKYGTHALHVKT